MEKHDAARVEDHRHPTIADQRTHLAREDQEARRSEYRAASAQALAEAVLAVMRK